MSDGLLRRAAMVATTALVVATPGWLNAADRLGLIDYLTGRGADLKQYECDKCGNVHGAGEKCIERTPVKDCVVGRKKLFDCRIMPEYVSIPETRYRWTKKLIMKEIPCPYCKPVCKSEDCQRCHGEEAWEKSGCECDELHCKHIEPKYENVPTKYCEHEKGETTIEVHYWSCVKEPYTVYRQVRREVCVKEPRYERVEVPVTRHVCEQCGGGGCSHCGN